MKTTRKTTMRTVIVALGALPLLFAACAEGTAVHVPTPTPSPTPTVQLGAASCHPPSPIILADTNPPQAQATTADGQPVWALFFNDPIRVNEQAKIVWRLAGSGDLRLAATGPGGRQLAPLWGPLFHTGSNWVRPGTNAEWGSGFTFPTAGCWDLRASRADISGDVYIIVR